MRRWSALLLPLVLAGCGLFAHQRGGPPPGAVHAVLGAPYEADGMWHYPRNFSHYRRTGLAVVIPPGHGAATLDGEAFHQTALAAQSPVLKLPSLVRVTNLANGRSLTVRVNDRGPAHPGRVLAVTRKVAARLGIPDHGVAEVRVRLLAVRSAALRARLVPGAASRSHGVPVAAVQASSLAPPPGAAGQAGPVQGALAASTARNLPQMATSLSGIARQGQPDPGPLYVEIPGFGSVAGAASIRARLGAMPGSIVPQYADGRTLFAIKLGPYGSVTAADAALRAALAQGVADPEITVR
jgi:rare lipoprotein A